MKINLSGYNPLENIFKLFAQEEPDPKDVHLELIKAGIYSDNVKELNKVVALLKDTYKEVNG